MNNQSKWLPYVFLSLLIYGSQTVIKAEEIPELIELDDFVFFRIESTQGEFWIAQSEVTQSQWSSLTSENFKEFISDKFQRNLTFDDTFKQKYGANELSLGLTFIDSKKLVDLFNIKNEEVLSKKGLIADFPTIDQWASLEKAHTIKAKLSGVGNSIAEWASDPVPKAEQIDHEYKMHYLVDVVKGAERLPNQGFSLSTISCRLVLRAATTKERQNPTVKPPSVTTSEVSKGEAVEKIEFLQYPSGSYGGVAIFRNSQGSLVLQRVNRPRGVKSDTPKSLISSVYALKSEDIRVSWNDFSSNVTQTLISSNHTKSEEGFVGEEPVHFRIEYMDGNVKKGKFWASRIEKDLGYSELLSSAWQRAFFVAPSVETYDKDKFGQLERYAPNSHTEKKK